MLSIRKLVKITWATKPVIASFSLLVSIIWSISPIVEIILIGKVVSSLSVGFDSNSNYIFDIVMYLSWAFLIPNVARKIQDILDVYIGKYTQEKLTSLILKKASSISLRFLELSESRNSIYRILSNQIHDGQKFVYEAVSTICRIIRIIMIVGFITWYSPVILLIIVGVTIPTVLIRNIVKKSEIEQSMANTEQERFTSVLYSLFFERSSAPEMWIYGVRAILSIRWRKENREYEECNNQFENKQAFYSILSNIIQSAGNLGSLLILMYLAINGKMQIDAIVSCFFGLQILQASIIQIMDGIVEVVQSKVLINEFNEVMSLEDEASESKQNSSCAIDSMPPAIEFKNVSYRYPGCDQYALKNVSLTINSGEKLALVGENGTGKSTIVRLILGLDKPTTGEILINGKKISECYDEVRANCTAMFQDFVKYELSVKNNIVISDYKMKDEKNKFDAAIDWADAKDIIENLSEGENTIMVKGGELSGGQWQKVASARTRFREGHLVVLDEPNAAIDAFHEVTMYRKFMELFKGCTAVIVSHRLSIARICDKIVVLEGNTVAEYGSHNALVEMQDGIYKKMFYSQSELYA